ncbi:MAG TPA: hypothetical protein PKE31_08380 [Pseudomonadota bacterium]|nr:hypothetical protein [Pseudomonadota bacterium]
MLLTMLGAQSLLFPVTVLDWLRARVLDLLGSWAIPLMRRPELRVCWRGSVAILVALIGSTCLPLWILALGPLFLGVPHLVSDVRYLIVRPGHQTSRKMAACVGIPLVLCGVGGGMPLGLLAACGVCVATPGRPWRRVLGLGLLLGVLALGFFRGLFPWFELALAHLHNPLAVVLWLLWRPRQERLHIYPIVFYLLAVLGLATGLFSAFPFGLASAPRFSEPVLDFFRDTLAPDFAEPWGTRLVLLYCFGQMVHYSMWLQVIPEEDRPRPTPRTFAATFRVLGQDLSVPLFACALVTMAGLWVYALRDLWSAREAYFRIATFHGYLEICALMYWFVAAQRPQKPRTLLQTARGNLPVSPDATA